MCLDDLGLVLRVYPDNILVHDPLSPFAQLSQEWQYLGLLHRPLRCYRLGDVVSLGCDSVFFRESLGYPLESGKLPLHELEAFRLHLLRRLRIVPESSLGLGVALLPSPTGAGSRDPSLYMT